MRINMIAQLEEQIVNLDLAGDAARKSLSFWKNLRYSHFGYDDGTYVEGTVIFVLWSAHDEPSRRSTRTLLKVSDTEWTLDGVVGGYFDHTDHLVSDGTVWAKEVAVCSFS